MARYKTLILDGKTIKKIVTMRVAIRAIEKGFRLYGEGKAQMPPKVYIDLCECGGDFRAMAAYVEGFKACGIKWVNVHPGNKRKGLPTVMGIMILSDPATGFPLCIMDATHTTALRTGAAGGVAAKYLARSDSKKVALVGCGVQAATQLAALKDLFDIERVNVWGRTPDEARRFIRQHGKGERFEMAVSPAVKSCVEDCDILVTTTPSREPIVKAAWLKKGVHINAIGADAKGKQELDPAILKKAKVVVDAWEQASHSGEINVPLSKKQLSRKDIYADIGEIVARKKKGRTRKDELTVFDSTGLAIQDVAIANLVYSKAKKLGKGRYIEFC